MKLATVIREYVQHKKSLGLLFRTEELGLRTFTRATGDIHIEKVSPEVVRAHLDGKGPLTTFWLRKYEELDGLYKYAIARKYVTQSPLPLTKPKVQSNFQPYIYTAADVKQLLNACHHPLPPARRFLAPHTLQTLILLLYGAGLRIAEAVRLRLDDFDSQQRLLLIRETKFYKSRLVPISSDLCLIVHRYVERQWKARRDVPALFGTRYGQPVSRQLAENTFKRLRRRAGVTRPQTSRYQPRLHDFRHTFAVNRLVSWYRQGKDVQRLLPSLSTYLGHCDINATQRYLTMTAELLAEANLRSERYAKSGVLHA
jgi:integrase/recombinase XerD